MRVDEFVFELPPERIAQEPVEPRDSARLLVLRAGHEEVEHSHVCNLASHLPSESLLVFNDTRVIPARLVGRKADTGGRVEIFLVRSMDVEVPVEVDGHTVHAEVWRAMGRASKPLREGAEFDFNRVRARLMGRAKEDGLLEVALYSRDGEPLHEAIYAVGQIPLPPYIKREATEDDAERYQTIFARAPGAIAAPTAGLHFTPRLLGQLAVTGCEVATITLHVGLGTFQPVTVSDLDEHPMHEEFFTISKHAAESIAAARKRGKPVVAIGTTTARALESAADRDHIGYVIPQSAGTRLLIQPPYHFNVVDLLLTNFHLPRSTLLALVSAFGEKDRVLRAYQEAIAKQYRFYSYGDAMLIHPQQENTP